jgi:hypothetical protein
MYWVKVQAKVLCTHPSPMHSLFPGGRAIKQIHGQRESIFYQSIFYTGGRGIVYFV